MAFPSVLNSFTRPAASDRLNNPSHSALHNTVSSALGQVEAVIGTDASVLGTIIGDLRSASSGGGGHVQTAVKGGTGQTTFTKGDILVAQSASVISKLAVGADGQLLRADSSVASGVKWGSAVNAPVVRVFSVLNIGGNTSSFVATWTKPSTMSYAVIEAVGGGGGGGGTTTATTGSGGGGGGGYARITLAAASLPTAASVILGQGGDGGTGAGGAGSDAGTTWFGSILSATGGTGGASAGDAGNGGRGTVGDIKTAGNGGGGGGTNMVGGAGGGAYFGGGARGTAGASAGASGSVFGGGGSGGRSEGADAAGGFGAAGGVIVYEYT